MKQSKHKMIDSYFQSSPPLTLVMDFFIYQQLSLSFSACPVQPALRFKCCVKQICASVLSATSTSRFALAAEQLASSVRSALRVVCAKRWARDRAGAAAALDTSPGDVPTAPHTPQLLTHALLWLGFSWKILISFPFIHFLALYILHLNFLDYVVCCWGYGCS